MLEPDPKKRLTAEQVLEHSWLQNAKKASNVPLGDIVRTRLKQFSVMNRFKKRALRCRVWTTMCATDKSVLGLSSNVLSSYYYYDLVPLPGSNNESWCQGLDGLASRSAEYYKQGARFAKWQTVVSIPCGPSALAVKEAAWGLARYAAISQDNGLVPIVEPKILLDGDHPIERTLYINVISNLCYIYRAARKQESMRLTAGSCLVRLVRFNHPSIQLVAEKLSFKDLASSLVKGSPREQQVSLNLLNMAMLGSHMLTNIGRYLIPLAEDKNLIPSLLSLVEQGSEILKGKALFFVALLCKHGRRWLPHFLAVHCLNTKWLQFTSYGSWPI
ncbi:uncharacterized protein [Arachis hypogaea]|nr:uncharacterized protein LOC112765524 isoform X1 [Arachis hypogaea]XP_025667199.1 uncharacterized protein LOC112765524 isoform X1 [Arachis hypogaea]XP_025667200.1 uncharacterized protein LOC112765524 isoform X1 [Arachis hypogaea]XP_025667201.1 uncharacterized protein LOC112765524 isoform X1 [Arachis hypogaea]XP_025667202.1 uncharacterized protein LOC112765524 isoform X1 [Arachis hypogaea]